jgi:hypothetical protein
MIVTSDEERERFWRNAYEDRLAELDKQAKKELGIACRFKIAWEGDLRVDLPAGWYKSLKTFRSNGLTEAVLTEMALVAINDHGIAKADKWRYFCGCCWNAIKKAREDAYGIATEPSESQ